jgi:hypothetical protein
MRNRTSDPTIIDAGGVVAWRARRLERAGFELALLELAGAAADEAVPGMRAHLDACPACNEEHVSLRALVELSRSPAPPAAR